MSKRTPQIRALLNRKLRELASNRLPRDPQRVVQQSLEEMLKPLFEPAHKLRLYLREKNPTIAPRTVAAQYCTTAWSSLFYIYHTTADQLDTKDAAGLLDFDLTSCVPNDLAGLQMGEMAKAVYGDVEALAAVACATPNLGYKSHCRGKLLQAKPQAHPERVKQVAASLEVILAAAAMSEVEAAAHVLMLDCVRLALAWRAEQGQ